MPLHALTKRVAFAMSLGAALTASAAHAEDWLTFGRTGQRNGYNSGETILSPQTVPNLRRLWWTALTGPIFGQPTLASGISIDDGTGNQVPIDIVFAVDLGGTVSALDAGTGAIIWQNQLPAIPTTCTDFVITHPCFGRSDQAVTVCRMVLKTLVPGLRRAVSTTLRMSASPSAAHMAR